MKHILRYVDGKVVLEKEEAIINWSGDCKTYYFCHNRDVATGKYECVCANVIDNMICCTSSCCYNAKGYREEVGQTQIDELNDEDFPF